MRLHPSERLRRSAVDWIAAALAAAAIFAVPGIVVGLWNGGLRGWNLLFGLLGLAAGLAALAFHGRRHRDKAAPAETAWAIVAGGFLAWAAGVVGFVLAFGADLCGNGRLATTVSWVAFALVYLVVAAWALLGRFRPLWGLPLALVLGEAVHYGALAAIPGGRGYCET